MEKRKSGVTRPSDLPKDFMKMIQDIFKTNFDATLKTVSKIKGRPFHFDVHGSVYAEEIVLAVSLANSDDIAATTVYASCDFDPKASSPTIQDLISACVDAIGSIYGTLTGPKQLERLLDESLASMDGIPFHWAMVEVDNFRVYVKVDKSNPRLEMLADEWLRKNDPELKHLEEETEEAMKELFVTGPKKGGRGSGGAGSLH